MAATDENGTINETRPADLSAKSTATNAVTISAEVSTHLTLENTSIMKDGPIPSQTTFAESTSYDISAAATHGSTETTSTSYKYSFATANSSQTTFYSTSADRGQTTNTTAWTQSNPNGSQESSSPIAGIVVLSILIVFLMAAILVYILWRRKRRSVKSKPLRRLENGTELREDKVRCNSLESLDEHNSSTVDSQNSKSQPITTKASKYSGQSNAAHSDADQSASPPKPKRDESPSPTANRREFLENLRRLQDDLTLYQKEFERLPNGTNKLCSVAKMQNNIQKNRYINVLPFDETRVILSKKGEEDSDYINASYIDGAKKKRAYIASQGPTNATLADFWTMVWDNECNRILMLTNLEESVRGLTMVKTSKCARYWPANVGEEVKYGDQSVRLLNESVGADWVVRTLALRREDCGLVRIVQQYHYTTWPDQDVPHTSTAVLQFHRLSLKRPDPLSASGPILFHCSAGVGRTGTLIAIDILEELWEDTRPFCDVYKVVKSLRHQRMSMVQSVRQYLFIHHSLVQSFFVGDSVELKPEQLEHYQLTSKHEEQFKVLAMISVTNIPQYSVAKSKPDKNRLSTVLPVNSSIRFLKPVREDDGIYINAIAVNGYKDKNSFIVTQMPLKDTINDFWRLANDNSCAAVVMLNSAFRPDERYWPEDVGDVMKTKSFKIQRTGKGQNHVTNGLLVTDLEICYQGDLKKSEDSSSEDDDFGSEESGSRRNSRNDRISGAHDLDGGQRWHPVMHLRVTDDDWPEAKNFPRDPLLLLNIYDRIAQLRTARGSKRPVVVHCMYGTTRSGLLCALVNVLDRLNEQGIVGIFDAVKLLKERRQELMPDVNHYDYLHKLVSAYLTRKREQGHVIGAAVTSAVTSDKKPEMTSDVNKSALDVGKTVAEEGGKMGKMQKDLVQDQTKSNGETSRHFDKEELVKKKNGEDKEETGKNNKEQKQLGKSENNEEKKSRTQKELEQESAGVNKAQLEKRENFTKDDRKTDNNKIAEDTKHCKEKDQISSADTKAKSSTTGTDNSEKNSNGKIQKSSELGQNKDTPQGQKPALTQEGQPASRPNDQNQRTANKNDGAESNSGNQRETEIETRTEKRTSARVDEGNRHQTAALVERL